MHLASGMMPFGSSLPGSGVMAASGTSHTRPLVQYKQWLPRATQASQCASLRSVLKFYNRIFDVTVYNAITDYQLICDY